MKRTIYYMILCLLMSLGEIMAQGISGKVMDGKEQPVDGVAVDFTDPRLCICGCRGYRYAWGFSIESSARPVVSTYFPTHLI